MRRSTGNQTLWLEKRGYTLIELLVVMVIIAILATQVVMTFNSSQGKLKGDAFRMRGNFNFARSEAVNRNTSVRVDFIFDDDPIVADRVDLDNDGDLDDGYRIWVDDNGDGNYVPWDPATDDTIIANGACDPGEGDCLIKAVAFDDDVEFYDVNAVNGPTVEASLSAPFTPLDMADGSGDDDGVSFNNDWFAMRADGSCNIGGTIYMYVPREGVPTEMRAGTMAVVVSPTTGRVRLLRWNVGEVKWATK